MLDESLQGGGDWSNDLPLRYVAQVMRKLDSGAYPVEQTKCYCGGSNDSVLTERDRYSIPHRMVLCEECMLIRANPRMTEEAYKGFYNDEYRRIYDGFGHHERWNDYDYLFALQYERAKDLKEFLSTLDINPKSVIDIGSDKGGTLQAFKEHGITVHGAEWCESSRQYSNSRGIPVVESIDDLIRLGIKADVVIMQDVIEHLMNLTEMAKIRELLNEGGMVFIYTPGLLACHPRILFQNAHTFQFIAATLEYVMNDLGFLAEFLDERIVSIWKYVGEMKYPEPKSVEWRKFIIEHLEQNPLRALPPVRTRCKFSEKEMLVNLGANLKRNLPTIYELKDKYSGPAIVIGGGPSVDGQIEKIKELVAKGYPLFVIERMYPWCAKHGLIPDFVVALDASDGVEDGFTDICQTTKHLVVATINPVVFDVLKGREVYIFSGVAGSFPSAQKEWAENGHSRVMIVNTGSTVVLGSVFLALVLGFRNIHLFGFDCMVKDADHDYAADIAGKSVERTYFEAQVGKDGPKVLTCPSFLAFAQQFFRMIDSARARGMIESIDLYGESLVNLMWEESQKQEMSQWQTSPQEIPSL